MKEYLIKVPDDAEDVITAVMEKFGVETIEVEKKKKHLKLRKEIINAVKEINQIKKGKKQARNAEDFLNELHG